MLRQGAVLALHLLQTQGDRAVLNPHPLGIFSSDLVESTRVRAGVEDMPSMLRSHRGRGPASPSTRWGECPDVMLTLVLLERWEKLKKEGEGAC